MENASSCILSVAIYARRSSFSSSSYSLSALRSSFYSLSSLFSAARPAVASPIPFKRTARIPSVSYFSVSSKIARVAASSFASSERKAA